MLWLSAKGSKQVIWQHCFAFPHIRVSGRKSLYYTLPPSFPTKGRREREKWEQHCGVPQLNWFASTEAGGMQGKGLNSSSSSYVFFACTSSSTSQDASSTTNSLTSGLLFKLFPPVHWVPYSLTGLGKSRILLISNGSTRFHMIFICKPYKTNYH